MILPYRGITNHTPKLQHGSLYSKVLYLKWLVLTRSQYAFDRGVLLPRTRGGLTQLQRLLMKTLEDSKAEGRRPVFRLVPKQMLDDESKRNNRSWCH